MSKQQHQIQSVGREMRTKSNPMAVGGILYINGRRRGKWEKSREEAPDSACGKREAHNNSPDGGWR